MPISSLLANHQTPWNVPIPARHALPLLMAFLSIALALPGRATPTPAAPPPFPVGKLTAILATSGPTAGHPYLAWKTALPEDASSTSWTFQLSQVQVPGNVTYFVQVQAEGEMLSQLPGADAAKFELWAIKNTTPVVSYLLDTATVGNYMPAATVTIRTEDPYPTLPRTRADRPVYVDINVQGVISDPDAPAVAKGVTLQQHVQSYGATGTGSSLNRELATLLSETPITSNGTTTLSIPGNTIPGANPSKARGEERFTIRSLEEYQYAEQVIDSRFVQVWPVADGSISGLSQGQSVGVSVPQLTFQLHDLYPSSTTWAQVYKGTPKLNFTGTTIPGTSVVINGSVPVNRTLTASDYGSLLDSDGVWTLELLTQTPFGTDRLAYVSFNVQRSALAVWRQAQFGNPSNSGDGADEGDFDGDGIANLIEFAYGLDPKQSSAGQLPVPERIGDQLSIRFTPPAGITGILHGVEWSSSLQAGSWLPVADTGIAPEHVFSVPTTDQPHIFLRLTATVQ